MAKWQLPNFRKAVKTIIRKLNPFSSRPRSSPPAISPQHPTSAEPARSSRPSQTKPPVTRTTDKNQQAKQKIR